MEDDIDSLESVRQAIYSTENQQGAITGKDGDIAHVMIE
jgi:hypothetical protein